MSVRYTSGVKGAAVVAIGLLASACKEPVGTPEDLAKNAEIAKPAPPASDSAPLPAPAPPPPLVPQAFKAEKPSALCSLGTTHTCAVDVIGGAPATDVTTVKRDTPAVMVGWGADGEALTVPPVVILQLKSAKKSFYAPAVHQTKRPDVADSLKAPALVDSGYDLLGDFNVIRTNYQEDVRMDDGHGNCNLDINVWLYDRRQTTYSKVNVCSTRSLTVTDDATVNRYLKIINHTSTKIRYVYVSRPQASWVLTESAIL